MLRELISIFRAGRPLESIGQDFARMVRLTHGQVAKAGELFFGPDATSDARKQIYDQDIEVNKLERRIRKHLITHLSVHSNSLDVPYCLLLMSLAKDVERIGDYAKNLSEVGEFCASTFPNDEVVAELRQIRAAVEADFRETLEVFEQSDRERALELIRQGRDLAQRCDALIGKIARSHYDAATSAALALGTRYYKRVGGHALNVLSSVVMPLHKLGFYDEDEIQPSAAQQS